MSYCLRRYPAYGLRHGLPSDAVPLVKGTCRYDSTAKPVAVVSVAVLTTALIVPMIAIVAVTMACHAMLPSRDYVMLSFQSSRAHLHRRGTTHICGSVFQHAAKHAIGHTVYHAVLLSFKHVVRLDVTHAAGHVVKHFLDHASKHHMPLLA